MDWINFDDWYRCAELERPGIVFEVQNAEGFSLFTPCVAVLELPFDWNSQPVRFRPVIEQPPRHSDPLPPPRGPRG